MNYGYLERGTIIQLGTILKMHDTFFEVVTFRAREPRQSYGRTIHNFNIEVMPINGASVGWQDQAEFDKQDLEEMLTAKTLMVYNNS